jgi:hypothetical protein
MLLMVLWQLWVLPLMLTCWIFGVNAAAAALLQVRCCSAVAVCCVD